MFERMFEKRLLEPGEKSSEFLFLWSGSSRCTGFENGSEKLAEYRALNECSIAKENYRQSLAQLKMRSESVSMEFFSPWGSWALSTYDVRAWVKSPQIFPKRCSRITIRSSIRSRKVTGGMSVGGGSFNPWLREFVEP